MAEVEANDQENSSNKKEEEGVPVRVFSRDAPPILHLLVVGFHHKKGLVQTILHYIIFLIS